MLLILAGVTISLALGDNGIIGKAQEASNMYANASKDERTALNQLSDEVSRLSRRGDDEGGSGGGESQSGTPTGMKNAANNETIYKTESATGTVTPLSTTGTTTVKDNKENEIKVPKNFGIAYDSGDNVADGIVIEDTNHNQYVWIPVGENMTKSNGDTFSVPLGRYSYASDGTPSAYYGSYQEYAPGEGSSYGNTKAKNITEFTSSANTNHGYYLARYEAGIDCGTDMPTDQYNYAGCSGNHASMTYADKNKEIKKDGTVKPLSKAGVGVWNAVTQLEAATICQAMYTKINDGVESDLINSYAWDTAIYYIQQCGTATNSGTYSRTIGKSTDTSGPKLTGADTLNATNAVDQQCKIFDMAGNCYEWSTEFSSDTNFPCVYRSGYYNDSYWYTSYRYGFRIDGRSMGISYRALLYM